MTKEYRLQKNIILFIIINVIISLISTIYGLTIIEKIGIQKIYEKIIYGIIFLLITIFMQKDNKIIRRLLILLLCLYIYYEAYFYVGEAEGVGGFILILLMLRRNNEKNHNRYFFIILTTYIIVAFIGAIINQTLIINVYLYIPYYILLFLIINDDLEQGG